MKQFTTFWVDERYVGVEVSRVQEVLRHQHVTPVPLAPAQIGGLVSLRGQILTALDLRARLDLEPRDADAQSANVIVTTDHGPVTLLVDRIGDVLEVGEDRFEEPPNTLRSATRTLIRGAYKLDGSLLLELDLDRTLEPAKGGRTT